MIAFAADAALPLRLLAPEALLAGGLLAVLLPSLVPALRHGRAATWLAVLAATAAFVAALFPALGTVAEVVAMTPQEIAVHTISDGGAADAATHDGAMMLAIDRIAAIARGAITFVLLLLLLARANDRDDARDGDAWAACVLGTGLGALLVAGAANVLPLWLGLELISLGSYALAAWRGGDRRAAEAGMKYVLFGGAATGLMLFGISHLYGLTGHFDFVGIGRTLQGTGFPVAAALCLAAVGIAYKLTIVPFHVYAPDVYQGAPPTSVAVVATLPKLAAGAVLLRALPVIVPPSVATPTEVGTALAGAAIASLVVGALLAVAQRDARRIIAFSGIGHGGTAVLGAAALPGADPTAAVLLHLGTYALAALGALVCLAVLERDRGSTDLRALTGALRERPWVTGALCLFLASLAGIPPLAGFLGKWAVLDVALRGSPLLFAGAMTLLATTAVFAWAYLSIVRAIVLMPAAEPTAANVPAPVRPGTALVLLAAAAAVVGLGVWLDVLAELRAAVGN